MNSSQASLQALIAETEALNCDSPRLEIVGETPRPQHGAYSLIGKLLSLKPVNSQTVRDTLRTARNFALPHTFDVIGPHKFFIGVPLQEHIDRILAQGSWNIRGSLLLLEPWKPDLAINEINLHL
jgi:hypothetical protein